MLLVTFFNQTISASDVTPHAVTETDNFKAEEEKRHKESHERHVTKFDPTNGNHTHFMHQIKEGMNTLSITDSQKDKAIELATEVLSSMQFATDFRSAEWATPNYSNAWDLAYKLGLAIKDEQNPAALIDIAKYVYESVSFEDKNASNFDILILMLSDSKRLRHAEMSYEEFKQLIEKDAVKLAAKNSTMSQFAHSIFYI